MQFENKNQLFNDVLSGFSLAPLIIVDSLGLGILVFAPLGLTYVQYGIYAGLTGGFLSMLFITLFRSKAPLISCPSTINSIILLGFVLSAMKYNLSQRIEMEVIIVMVVMIIMLAAIFQVLISLMKLTKFICKIHRDVLTGALNGLGILIIVLQVPTLLGLGLKEITGLDYIMSYVQPWTVSVGVITLLALFSAKHWVKRYRYMPPVLITGMGIGIGIYYYISHAAISPDLGPRIDEFDYSFEMIGAYIDIFHKMQWSYLISYMPSIILTAATIAIFSTIQNYMCMSKDNHNLSEEAFNLESLKQGFGNIFTSMTGGLWGAASIGVTEINKINGGKTRLVNYTCVVTILLCLLFFEPFIESIPYIVVAAVFVYIGLTYVNKNTFLIYLRMLVRAELSLQEKQHAILSLATMIFVLGIDLHFALLVSILLSYVVYMPAAEEFLDRKS